MDHERLAFRVAQECFRTIARHAAARRVDVILDADGHEVVLEIRDDGVGFNSADVLSDPESGHFGVRILADIAGRPTQSCRCPPHPDSARTGGCGCRCHDHGDARR